MKILLLVVISFLALSAGIIIGNIYNDLKQPTIILPTNASLDYYKYCDAILKGNGLVCDIKNTCCK